MQRDKGVLEIHGRSQAEHCLDLLAPSCRSAFVSVRAEQAEAAPYANLPTLTDDPTYQGPAAGLLTAWSKFENEALLVLAVDLVLITPETLAHLVTHRDPERAATAFCHPDGTIEPLCTIWEPRSRAVLESGSAAPSLRRVLEESDVAILNPPHPDELVSANTPAALEAARQSLARAPK